MPDRVNLSKGIDLGVLKNKQFHNHLWSVLVTHAVSPDAVKLMYEEAQKPVEEQEDVNIPLNDDSAVRYEGPGCLKCRGYFMVVYGELCPVSDADVLGVEKKDE